MNDPFFHADALRTVCVQFWIPLQRAFNRSAASMRSVDTLYGIPKLLSGCRSGVPDLVVKLGRGAQSAHCWRKKRTLPARVSAVFLVGFVTVNDWVLLSHWTELNVCAVAFFTHLPLAAVGGVGPACWSLPVWQGPCCRLVTNFLCRLLSALYVYLNSGILSRTWHCWFLGSDALSAHAAEADVVLPSLSVPGKKGQSNCRLHSEATLVFVYGLNVWDHAHLLPLSVWIVFHREQLDMFLSDIWIMQCSLESPGPTGQKQKPLVVL